MFDKKEHHARVRFLEKPHSASVMGKLGHDSVSTQPS